MTARADLQEALTDPTRPVIAHAARCSRRGAPILRLSWSGSAEAWCPSCGRHGPAPDTREAEDAQLPQPNPDPARTAPEAAHEHTDERTDA